MQMKSYSPSTSFKAFSSERSRPILVLIAISAPARSIEATAMSISRLTMISRDRHVVDEHVVEALLDLVRIDPLAHRQVALRVEVDAEHAVAGLREGDGEVERGRRLGHPTLLVGEGDDVGVLDRRLRLGSLPRRVQSCSARSGRRRHHPSPARSSTSALPRPRLGVTGLAAPARRGLRRLSRGWRGWALLARSLRGRGVVSSATGLRRAELVSAARARLPPSAGALRRSDACSSTWTGAGFGLRLRNPIARIFVWGAAFPAGLRNC